jgi:hypothetical protein
VAISIEWGTKVITVTQTDTDILTQVSGTLYEMDTLAFQRELKDLEDDEEGMPFPDTHEQALENTISGVTYVRAINIINGYSLTFSPNSQWTVLMDGASNNNFHDIAAGILNQNQVQVIPQNSAGNTISEAAALATLQSIDTSITAIEGDIATIETDIGTLQVDMATASKIMRNKKVTDEVTGILTVYDDNGVDVYLQANLYESTDTSQAYRGQGLQRQERLT